MAVLCELVYEILFAYGYITGGTHKSMLKLKYEDFSNFVYDPYNDCAVSPDYHFKQMTKKWVSENNWRILILDTKFNFERKMESETNSYEPDAVIFDGEKTVIIEFDEDNKFHSAKMNNWDENRFKQPYYVKWENYDYILKQAKEKNTQICLLRVAYGSDKKSKGINKINEFTKEINDFKTIEKIDDNKLILNDYAGELDKIFVKTLNYINNCADISGKIILIHYNGKEKKIKSGVINSENVVIGYQGKDYMEKLNWNTK